MLARVQSSRWLAEACVSVEKFYIRCPAPKSEECALFDVACWLPRALYHFALFVWLTKA